MQTWTLYKMGTLDLPLCYFEPPNTNFDSTEMTINPKFWSYKEIEYLTYSYIPTTSVHNFKPIYLFLAVQWPKYKVKVVTSLL